MEAPAQSRKPDSPPEWPRYRIAFPKTASATDLMSEAPNVVDVKQLNELGIKIK